MGGTSRIGSLALVAVLGLGLVACGDGKKVASNATTTTTGSSGTDGADAYDFTGDCADFLAAFSGASASIGAAFSGGADADLEEAANYFENVGDKLPKEIRVDFEVFAEAYRDFAKAMADADIDFSDPSSMDPEQMSELQALGDAFSDPKVTEASANIEAYMEANCKAE